MTKTLIVPLAAAALALAACSHGGGNTTDAAGGNTADASLNDTLPADEGLGNSDTLNAGDASLEGNGSDTGAAPAGNAQ